MPRGFSSFSPWTRHFRETSDFVRALRHAGLQNDWTFAGAKRAAAMMLEGRKDLYGLIPTHAANFPDKPAIVKDGRVVSYRELSDYSGAFAAGLAERGVGRRDRVVVALGNSAEAIIASAGCNHLGAMIVPMSTHHRDREVEHVVTHADAKVVLLTKDQWHDIGGHVSHTPAYLQGRVVGILGQADEGEASAFGAFLSDAKRPKRAFRQRDPDIMMYTSGTTGKPKGAQLNMHRVSYLRAFEIICACGFARHTRFYTACPVYHAAPTAFIGFTLATGGTIHLDDKFDAEAVWRYLDEAEITCAFMVPTQIVRLLNLPDHLLAKKPRALDRIMSGGAPLPLPIKQRALDRIGPVWDFYGATELGLVSLASPDDMRRKPGTVGQPFPGVDVAFLDDDGNTVSAYQRGTLFVASNQFDFDYYKNREATEQSQRGRFRTVGDVGYADEDGYLYVVDRKVDMIISGGVNIYPAEVEQVLLEHPAVADAAVVGTPDDEWGESVCAFVVLRTGYSLSEAEAIDHCAQSLASLKKPKRVVFLTDIARSPQGKILKRLLRERLHTAD